MDYLTVLAAEGERIVSLARRGPLAARVPYMAEWTMEDVVAHLGGVHRWAAQIVAARHFDGSRHQPGTAVGPPLVDWFAEGVAELVNTLEQADVDDACGYFSNGSPATVGFWCRRQAHETTIHRWDVEASIGEHLPIDAQMATDGIDELFHTFTRTRGEQRLDAPIRVSTTDTGASWALAPADQPGRVDLTPEPGPVAAKIEGQAEQVLLALWKRVTLDGDRLELTGSVQTVRDFVAGPITP